MHRYKLIKKLGEGAQGIVSKAKLLEVPPNYDISANGSIPEYVAIKKMKIVSYETGISIETIREIQILRELRHSNIISIIDIFGRGDHIYVIMHLMITDLQALIYNRKILLPFENVKSYMQMIFSGLSYIHSRFVLHRDIKPSNCLIGSDNRLRISDFGLSREYGNPNKQMSYQACTIWYRSPELLFGANAYGPGLDVWSAGCVFAELLLRLPIFPGQSEIEQLQKIFCVLGTPNEEEWKDMNLLPKYRKFTVQPKYNMNEVFRAVSDQGIDLFLNLCRFNPNDRLSAVQALKHPYFTENPLPTAVEDLRPLGDGKQNINQKQSVSVSASMKIMGESNTNGSKSNDQQNKNNSNDTDIVMKTK